LNHEKKGRRFRRFFAALALGLLPGRVRNSLAVHLGRPDCRFSLSQLRRFGFMPRHVLDIGAHCGEWSEICLDVWPNTSICCFEPQQGPQEVLRQFAQRHTPKVALKQALVGDVDRDSIPFCEIGTGSSVLASQGSTVTRPMCRVDTLIDEGLSPPELVKIDVQGFELQVLAGFEKHLRDCQVLQIELSLLPIVPNAALLHEVVAYLKERGFVMVDVDELIRAPSDGAVWQIDALFCREELALRQERTWT
jgi:FkbM family methyltransferase